MNEKMFQPEPRKAPKTKILPEHLQKMILDEQPVAHEEDVRVWEPPVKEEPKFKMEGLPKKDATPTREAGDDGGWVWGDEVAVEDREAWEKDLPPESEIGHPLPRFELEDEAGEIKETKAREPRAETLRSADEVPTSGVRETLRSDFGAKGTVKTSSAENTQETNEVKTTSEGFVKKDEPGYEMSVLDIDSPESTDTGTLRSKRDAGKDTLRAA
ncbi:hypothetical protein KKG46_03740 [Patescibacteria group bacterium]|nr:hypothetical protein [Patescibacteria group bacterium]